jgi:hypothetical protein
MNKWLTEFCQYIDSQDSLILDDVFKKKSLLCEIYIGLNSFFDLIKKGEHLQQANASVDAQSAHTTRA